MSDRAADVTAVTTPAADAERQTATRLLDRTSAPGAAAGRIIGLSMLASTLGVTLLAHLFGLDWAPVVTAVLISSALAALIVYGLLQSSRATPKENGKAASVPFGLANTITTVRAGMTALLAAFIPVASQLQSNMLWTLTLIAILALMLDGVDGYIARARHECSAFGARFDMEIDALLALVICLLLWRSGESGVWILGLGVMRYAFIVAGWKVSALQAPLFPSFRRKLVCVIQVGALCALLSPVISGQLSLWIGLIALTCLAGSFARDTAWLLSRR